MSYAVLHDGGLCLGTQLAGLRLGHGPLDGLDDVADEVLRLLDAARDADEVVEDTHAEALGSGDAGVRHAGGHLDEGFDASQGFGEREDLRELAESVGRCLVAPETEAQHAAAHAVAVLGYCDLSLRVRCGARVVDGRDEGVGLERRGDGCRVDGRLARTQVKCLETTVGEPAVKGRWNAADCVLEEAEALVSVVAVEGDDAHDDVAVPVDVLCDAVDDHVGSEVEWVLDVRREERVVDNDLDAALMCDGCHGADVDEPQRRVGRRLDPDDPRIRLDVFGQVELDLGRERDVDAVRERHLREVPVRAAVDVRDAQDVRPRRQRLHDEGRCRRARGQSDGILGVLYGGHGPLEVVPVRVPAAAVLVQADGHADRRLRKRRRQGDGLDDGPCRRIDGGSRVHR